MAIAPAGAPPPPAHGARTRHRAQGRDHRAPGRRGGAGARAGAAQGGRRCHRRLPAARLSQSGARAAHQGDSSGGVSRRLRLGLQRGAAALPRVRALLDDLPERLRRPAGGQLRRPARVRLAGCRARARRAADAVLRRDDDGGERDRRPGQPDDVGAGRGAHRRHLGRQDGRLRQRVHPRYRWHVRRHRRGRRRRSQDAPPARYQGRRLSGHDPDGRHRHHRRGRRLHRLRRRGRHLPRRPAVRRRRAGPRLLRARRRRAHLDGRAGGAGAVADRPRARRRADDAPRRSRPGRAAGSRRHARHAAGGDRARCAADPEVQHGAGDRAQQRAARLRSARLHARRRRRRRSALRLRHRGRAGDPAGAGAAASRHPLGHRAARHGHAARVRHDRAPAARHPRPRPPRGALSRTHVPGDDPAGDRRRAGGRSPDPPPRGLPLRRPGLRGPLRCAGRRDRRRLDRRAGRPLPPRARSRVRPPLRRARRDHQHPRRGHRPHPRPRLAGDRRRHRRGDAAAVPAGRLRGRGQGRNPRDPVLRPFRAPCGRPHFRPCHRRAVRHDHRDPAPLRGGDRCPAATS